MTVSGTSISEVNEIQSLNTLLGNLLSAKPFGIFTLSSEVQRSYLQPIITQYFIDNKSEIWLLFLIAHSKR